MIVPHTCVIVPHTRYSVAQSAVAAADDDEAAFVAAFEAVVKSPQAAREIAQLEQSYEAAIAELLASKSSALATLHRRQSSEMEALIARSAAGRDTPAHVVRVCHTT